MQIPTFETPGEGLHGHLTKNSSKRKEKKRIEDSYTFLEELGKGAFGVVRKARSIETGLEYAVKIIDKAKAGAAGMSEIFSEVEIISMLSHRYIVDLKEVFENKEYLYLVMELLLGGALETCLRRQGRFSESVTRRIVRNVFLAVEYIHRKGIVHRDLKPANMLLATEVDPTEVKIADFGLAVFIGSESCLVAICGTAAFMAPEILSGDPYGQAVDMWSMGVIIYLLLSGTYPFYGPNDEMNDRIANGEYEIPEEGVWSEVTNGAKDLIRSLLSVDPKKRMSAMEVLNHPWVRLGPTEEGLLRFDVSVPVITGPMKSKSKLKRCILVIKACNRLIFWQRCAWLDKLGVEFPIMYHFGHVLSRSLGDCREVDTSALPIGSNKGFHLLMDMVNNSSHVESLFLANRDLGYDAIQGIVRTATNHSSLTAIDLSGNPITTAGARALLRLARTNPKIRFLTLKGCNVPHEIIAQISQALKENEKRKRESTFAPSTRSGTLPVMPARTPSPNNAPPSFPYRLHDTNNTLPLMPPGRKHGVLVQRMSSK